jgi:hypothetical protein
VALSDRDRAILDFERSWWTQDSPRDVLIVERFECSPEAYLGELNALLESPDALAYDPLVVRRLRRLRDRRRRHRLESLAADTEREVQQSRAEGVAR